MDTPSLITATPLGNDAFRGLAAGTDERRTFGGLFAAQMLSAAAGTVDGRPCNALHLLFIGGGDNHSEVRIEVDRLRDGRSFSARQLRLKQHGAVLVAGLASFHGGDDGPDFQIGMPAVADPETLEDTRLVRRARAERKGKSPATYVAEEVLEQRIAELRVDDSNGTLGLRAGWFRTRSPIGDDPVVHQATIAFASDMGLVHAAVNVHHEQGNGERLDETSLDHAIWYHRPARADDWLLHVQRAPTMTAGRGMSYGAIFDRSGRLIASTAQELLARYDRRERAASEGGVAGLGSRPAAA
jgi:acyl-CoA thioesterase II